MKIITVILLSFLTQCFWAQTNPKDTAKKITQLSEVCISDDTHPDNASFNFYKGSKLANTEDILSRMEGVSLIKRGAYGLEPILRNYGSGQTNITIDGMRIYGACTDKMDPVSIYVEPVNLQSIQVAHGAAGALNGSTIGGQINFNLKEPSYNCNKKIHGQVGQSYSTINKGSNTNFALQQTLHKFSYRVSGALRDAGNYKSGDNIQIKNSGFHKSNLSAALSYKIDSLQTLKINYLGDWGKFIGYPALPMDVGSASAQIYSMSHHTIFKNKKLESNELKVYYNHIVHQMDDTQRPEAPMHMDMPGWSTTFGFYDNLSIKKGIKLRVDYHHVNTRADMIMYPSGEPLMYLQTLPENNLSNIGFSLQKLFTLKHKQQINLNGRIDLFNQSAISSAGINQWKVFNTDISTSKQDFLKNLNLNYSKLFTGHLFLQLTFGYGERIATSNERYGYYLYNRQDQFDYIGNISLKPERSYQTELRIKKEFKKVEVSMNLFYHLTKDYIYSYKLDGYGQMTIGAFGLKTYKNIDYALSTGAEFTTKFNVTERLTHISSIKYVYAETHNGKPLPLVPPFKLQQALRFKIQLTQIQLEHDYAYAQNRINIDYGDRQTPSFHLFNLRIAQNIRIKSSILQLGIACENIFDQNYREHLDIGNIPRFGRNFLMNASLLF
ncbi:TonB-dependent receptor [Aurantibacillus circumpalustris]|uniref:TonB-dependent receptor n=1 Tax=Aurantibacillus circumpalustris TaxID=3036359 RepID=UPI00295B6E26|nr:TonB-dependent receptor [Aurantibacillus circumpalustris]